MDTQNETSNINIVFASDNNYAQHAAVAMVSILINTKSPQQIYFYLLNDNISETTKEKMIRSVEKFGSSLSFVAVDSESFSKFFVSGQLSRAAYFRLEMAKLLPTDVHKVIYLDCDLIVRDDISKLWNIDLDGHPVGAVPDFGIMASSKDWIRKQKTLGHTPNDYYFNSGVLVVDLEQWRQYKYGQQVEELARTNDYQHHDQDALNKVFYNNWKAIPLRWNVVPPIWNMFLKILLRDRFRGPALEARRNIAILHYAGGYKPWEYNEYIDFNSDYYSCLKQSNFKDAIMPQPDKRRKHRSIERQLCRIHWGDFWQKIL